jgi:hypothetical protein
VSGHIPSWPRRTSGLREAHDESAAWTLYELDYVRREAQAEANAAYLAWCELPGRDGYVVYRAAQDRADAAQDALAAWVRGSELSDPGAGWPMSPSNHVELRTLQGD